MKQLLPLLLLLTFLSCNKIEPLFQRGISLEDAQAEQFIRFDIGKRKFDLTDLKEDPWPFHGTIVWTKDISFDSTSHHPISRSIYATIPEDQTLPNHIETFGLEFNHVFSKDDLQQDLEQVESDEQFANEFLQVGVQDFTFANFGFHQTYFIGFGKSDSSSIQISKIEAVREHPDMIFVTGKFSGSISNNHINKFGEVSNGEFKVLIAN